MKLHDIDRGMPEQRRRDAETLRSEAAELAAHLSQNPMLNMDPAWKTVRHWQYMADEADAAALAWEKELEFRNSKARARRVQS